jgi:hypothetical protein
MPSQSPSPWRCGLWPREHQSFGVYQQVALPTFYLLSAIVTALLSTYPGTLDRLAIYDSSAWLRVPIESNSHPLTYGLVHPFPGVI